MNNCLKPPPETPWNIISLGAGVQSSCMALMAAKGEITPMPQAAVFADTQGEPGYLSRNKPKGQREGIYKWLDWLTDELPFPVYTVTKGDLMADSLKPSVIQTEGCKRPVGTSYMKQIIPLFGEMPDGTRTAALGRKCTSDYKIVPVHKKIKELAEISRGQKNITVTTWIGISKDEIQRMKDSRVPWAQHRWPLIEKYMERHHCLEWMKKNGYPEPPRSACFYCPFHSDTEWRKLRDHDPDHFADAITFDETIREQTKEHDKQTQMEVYLHNSCVPLSDIDFDSEEQKGQQVWDFMSECEGMCGV